MSYQAWWSCLSRRFQMILNPERLINHPATNYCIYLKSTSKVLQPLKEDYWTLQWQLGFSRVIANRELKLNLLLSDDVSEICLAFLSSTQTCSKLTRYTMKSYSVNWLVFCRMQNCILELYYCKCAWNNKAFLIIISL